MSTSCAIEIEFERSASNEQIAAFRRRVEAIPRVAHVEIVSRKRQIERFIAELRRHGYRGEEFNALAARARRWAGALLVVTPQEVGDAPRIIGALTVLPAAVSSVFDRDSCTT